MSVTLVSVLMTSYNREKYIAEAIESVLASTLSNFELIIVDDCSTDNTVNIINRYLITDNRIKFYRNKKNLGQFANRNKAAKYAIGDFLKYVDSDDIIYPHTLQVMVESMLRYPDAGLGFCYTQGICKAVLPYKIEPKSAIYHHYLKGGLLSVGPSGLIIRRFAFESVNNFEEFGMPSDNHLSLKIASKYPIVAMEKDLFWWRIHEGQVFINNINNYENIIYNYQFSKDIIGNYSPLTMRQNKKILFNLVKILTFNILSIIFIKFKPLVAYHLLIKLKNLQ